MTVLASAIAVTLLLWTLLLYVPFRWRPVGIYLFTLKVFAVAFAGVITVAGAALAVVGIAVESWWIAAPAALAAIAASVVTVRVGAVRPDLSGALGPDWQSRIPDDRRRGIVGPWWRGRLPRVREPRVQRDVPFATVPETGRTLVCDVWKPALDVRPSALAVVFLHGSGYYIFDKDFLTRRLFRHLAAQGHVVVDVAHRLFPEADVPGMVADAKRAVAWVRDHATELGVDRDRIVLTGDSSGGHLSLLAAYAHEEPVLTPSELAGSDPTVCGVVSLYGQVHLAALYEHTSQAKVTHRDDPLPDWSAPTPRWMVRLFGENVRRLRLQFFNAGGRCDWLMGGTPSEVPERYTQVSARRYVRPDCPPTLLIHGLHDEMAPVAAARELEGALKDAGAPVTAVYLPHADHMLDIALAWSPAARSAIHALEVFLAVLAATDGDDASHRALGRAVPARAA
jgi:acetyl esterase/lipase